MRIAILKPSALGDIVHALPILSALRDAFPDAAITWVANRVYEPLLQGHPELTATLPFDRGAYKKGIIAGLRATHQFALTMRRQRFDWVIDLQGLLRTGLMAGFSGAPRKIGFANAREGSRRFYTEVVEVPDAERIHAVERYWRVAEHLGIGNCEKRFVLPIQPRERDAVHDLLKDYPRPWLAMAPGARWTTKCWPAKHFASLASMAQREFGGSVLFVGTSDDTDLSERIVESLTGPTLNLCGQTPLPLLSALLLESDVMIANDTGPLHLAAALGTPCVAPYTCTKPILHGPFGQLERGIATTVSCRGSYLRDCPNGLICFDELTPDRLWPTLREVLQTWARRSPSR